MVTSRQARIEPHSYFAAGSVDPTEVRKPTVRRFGRSDRRAQGGRPTLRSITPTRATSSLAASVDPTDARKDSAALVMMFDLSHLFVSRGDRRASVGRVLSLSKPVDPGEPLNA
jgi:hypothetical protein